MHHGQQRDDLEDEELQANQMTEAMPTSMQGFKDHPLYVLARHLKRDEVVDPPVELGKFRGEPVYPRANVLQLKTAENWMRQGRTVVAGAQPLKWVKQRAVTVNKKRAIEMALADQRERAAAASGSGSASGSVKGRGDGDTEDGLGADADVGGLDDELPTAGEGFASENGVMQGLYAEHQTELYRPPPVVDVSSQCMLFVACIVLRREARAGKSAEERLWEHRSVCAVYASRRCGLHSL